MDVIVETSIDAPTDVVWDVVAHRFADIAQWLSDIESSRVVQHHELAGMVPAPEAPVAGRVTVSRVLTATEVLTEYSEEGRRFTFEATGLPKWVVPSMQSTTTVAERQGGGSVLRMHVQIDFSWFFRPLAFVMKRRMTALYGRFGTELKAYVEPSRDSAASVVAT